VAKRIATMGRISPEIIREVKRVLEKKVCTLSSEDYVTSGGVENTVTILKSVDKDLVKQMLEDLEKDDLELAETLKRKL